MVAEIQKQRKRQREIIHNASAVEQSSLFASGFHKTVRSACSVEHHALEIFCFFLGQERIFLCFSSPPFILPPPPPCCKISAIFFCVLKAHISQVTYYDHSNILNEFHDFLMGELGLAKGKCFTNSLMVASVIWEERPINYTLVIKQQSLLG